MTDQKDVVLHVRIPKQIVEKMDKLIEKGYFMNRSNLVRFAVRVVVEELGKGKE